MQLPEAPFRWVRRLTIACLQVNAFLWLVYAVAQFAMRADQQVWMLAFIMSVACSISAELESWRRV